MGLKTFDVEAGKFQDGAVATADAENWSSNEPLPKSVAQQAEETAQQVADEDAAHAESNSGLKIAMKPKNACHFMRVEIPEAVISEINKHIEEDIFTVDKTFGENFGNTTVSNSVAAKTYAHNKSTLNSAQLDFPFDSQVGGGLKHVLDQCAKTYAKNAFDLDIVADTNNGYVSSSFAGDYSPSHKAFAKTPYGFKIMLALKVPAKLESKVAGDSLASNSGAYDGFTRYEWNWSGGKNPTKPFGYEYVKPEAGVMLIFPDWVEVSSTTFKYEGELRMLTTIVNAIPNLEIKSMTPEAKIAHIESLRG